MNTSCQENIRGETLYYVIRKDMTYTEDSENMWFNSM